jgi:hypothetical protein
LLDGMRGNDVTGRIVECWVEVEYYGDRLTLMRDLVTVKINHEY